MRVIIEEAIIVEVNETEPHFPVETVRPEIISDKKSQQGSLLDSLFDVIVDPFSSLFGDNSSTFGDSLFGSLFDLFSDPFNELEEKEPKDPIQEEEKPEIAVITETKEKRVKEYTFFYYEVVQ